MPELILETAKSSVDVYPLQPEQHRILGICSQNRDFMSPAAKVMLKHIKSYVSTLKGSLVDGEKKDK